MLSHGARRGRLEGKTPRVQSTLGSTRSLARSTQIHATVDVQRLSRDVAGTGAAQKTDRGGNLLGASKAAQQGAAHLVVLRQGPIWIAVGIDQAGNDAIGRDAVAGELVRESPV
jgi:hypothetical protein